MAYVFDALGIEWVYEPKSFLLPGGYHYRPDFWLPHQKMWVECRGYKRTGSEEQIDVFAQTRPDDEQVMKVADKRLGGVCLWVDGTWVEAGVGFNKGQGQFVEHDRKGQTAKIVAANSRVRFMPHTSSKSVTVDVLVASVCTQK